MNKFQHIDVNAAHQLLNEGGGHAVDIRDPQSYQAGHIPGARHLDNNSVQDFLREADPDQPLIVVCYHGNSSQSAAQFLAEKDFTDVYSMDGGMTVWQQQALPVSTD